MSNGYITVNVRVDEFVDVDIDYDDLKEEDLEKALRAKRKLDTGPLVLSCGDGGRLCDLSNHRLLELIYDRLRATPIEQRPPELCELLHRTLGRIL